jgi:hypothetical protein
MVAILNDPFEWDCDDDILVVAQLIADGALRMEGSSPFVATSSRGYATPISNKSQAALFKLRYEYQREVEIGVATGLRKEKERLAKVVARQPKVPAQSLAEQERIRDKIHQENAEWRAKQEVLKRAEALAAQQHAQNQACDDLLEVMRNSSNPHCFLSDLRVACQASQHSAMRWEIGLRIICASSNRYFLTEESSGVYGLMSR